MERRDAFAVRRARKSGSANYKSILITQPQRTLKVITNNRLRRSS
jgi:hypothetical protein